MVTLKRRASNLFPYGHLYSFIHSVDCTAQFWCPTTEIYTFIYTLNEPFFKNEDIGLDTPLSIMINKIEIVRHMFLNHLTVK